MTAPELSVSVDFTAVCDKTGCGTVAVWIATGSGPYSTVRYRVACPKCDRTHQPKAAA